MPTILSAELKKIALIGTYLPRQCGIATFSADLADSIDAELGQDGQIFALAMDDIPEGYRYPDRVRFQLRTNVQADYSMAADFITSSQANVVIVQHEFGIFGGPCGAHILRLLRELRVPVLTTLHTVLKEPNPEQRRIMDQLWRLSDRLIVMSRRAESMLGEIYSVPAERIAFIPHGIPDVPFVDPNYYKDQFKAEGRRVILTFGLLSPNKGIEHMIEAMPSIVKEYPDVLYIVLGATHPHLRKQYGEAYRNSLQRRVADLGLVEHVRFRNRFVELDELCEYIGAADLYVTPYLGEEQITSGTLAYAVGAGKAVVSTPYWYAQELLDEGRGLLVPFRDPARLAGAVIHLLRNDTERHQMRKRAYTFCREMIWKQVAREYILLANQVAAERAHCPRPMVSSRKRVGRPEELPELDLRHLRELTDDTGIVHHCLYTTAHRRHGYRLDDNARALVVCALHSQLSPNQASDLELPASRYLSLLLDAFHEGSRRFRNSLSYQRIWEEDIGSEESHARALWGLGMMAAHAVNENQRWVSVQLFQQAVEATEAFTSPRAWAYALLGIHAYLERYGGDAGVRRLRAVLAERLFGQFRANAREDWQWFEPVLTYSNATLAQAMILAGTWMPHNDMRAQGLRTLEWLARIQRTERGHFSFIGTHGGFPRGGERALFDQQPIEAMQMCLACAEAYRATGEEVWLAESRLALEWFLGRNDLGAQLYDFSTGGCFDALTPVGPNVNQGAEAQLSWLIALLSFLVQIGRQTLEAKPEDVGTHSGAPPKEQPARSAAGISSTGGSPPVSSPAIIVPPGPPM